MSNFPLPIAGKVFETVKDKTGSPLPIASKLAELLQKKDGKQTNEMPMSMQRQPQGGMAGPSTDQQQQNMPRGLQVR